MNVLFVLKQQNIEHTLHGHGHGHMETNIRVVASSITALQDKQSARL